MSKSNLPYLGISSIAWDPNQDQDIAHLLSKAEVKFIDIAPTKYFDWDQLQLYSRVALIRKSWEDEGVSIRGMQSLMFGLPHLNIFDRSRTFEIIEHFKLVTSVAHSLGATKLVFGSPKNRSKGDLSDAEANHRAAGLFEQIASNLVGTNIQLLIEPNPINYGCDFVTSTQEAIDLVSLIGHPNVKAQLDLGTCLYNDEDPIALLKMFEQSIGFIHLSTFELSPLHLAPNKKIHVLIDTYLGDIPMSIEELTKQENRIDEIEKSIMWVRKL